MEKINYSHLFNKHGAWNKRGGGAKVAKSLNVEVGISKRGGWDFLDKTSTLESGINIAVRLLIF